MKKERHTCETCWKYEAVPDTCREGRSTRDPKICWEGCKEWKKQMTAN